jgi:hypothetical protein
MEGSIRKKLVDIYTPQTLLEPSNVQQTLGRIERPFPKLCQIRDNLYSNYTATLFPKRKWLVWDAYDANANQVA